MDGYVGENSTFKTTVFKLLSDLKQLSSTNSLNLYYINSKPIKLFTSVARDEIQDFYNRLNPTDFKNEGGKRGSSDMEHMLKGLLDSVNDNTLNIFISDCVFSPGDEDARKYLEGQYAALYNDFLDAKNNKKKDISVAIIQCISPFDGTYYDYLNEPHSGFHGDRPYYIWFIGTTNQIKTLSDNRIFESIKKGYKNKVIIQSPPLVNPSYKILTSNKIGDFRLLETAKGPISNAEPCRDPLLKGSFGFNLAIDFSNLIQEPEYFMDTNNYSISGTYHLQVQKLSEASDISLKGFTHLIKVVTPNLANETLKIEVLGKIPKWVYDSHSTNDVNIMTDDSQKLKTFGFQYCVEGIVDAFYPKGRNAICTIEIPIKR